MLTSLQEFYEYILGDRADVEASIKQVPEAHKAKQRDRKKEKIKTVFFGKQNPIIDARYRDIFRVALRLLNAQALETILYGNTTDQFESPYLFPEKSEIEIKFQQFEKTHHFFDANEYKTALEKFSVFFKTSKLIGDFIEENNHDRENNVAYLHAYKLLVIFGNQDNPKKYFQSFDEYIKNHNFQQERNAVHDVLVWELPKNKPPKQVIHLSEWRKIIYSSGTRALKLFHLASEIEKELKKAPETFKDALTIAHSLTYKKAKADPELAEICMQYGVQEYVFNKCLEVKSNRKKFDNLPSVVIDGKEIDKPGYVLTKLPIEDPRAFLLGYITNCCQSIGSHSERCVIDGVTRPNNGFYVLLKRKQTSKNKTEAKETKEDLDVFKRSENGILKIDYAKYDIVGQGYAWLSTHGNLTFDSWENLHPEAENSIIVKMLEQFSKTVLELKNSSILRVTIGLGGKTPRQFLIEAPHPETQLEGNQYGDSKYQQLVGENKELQQKLLNEVKQEIQKLQNSVAKITSKESSELVTQLFNIEEILSIQQANAIKALLHNKKLFTYFVQPEKRAVLLKILRYQKVIQELLVTRPTVLDGLLALQDKQGEFHGINKNFKAILTYYIKNKEYLLSMAIHHDKIDAFTMLLEEKPNLNMAINYGNTKTSFPPLCKAVLCNNVTMIQALISAKANVNVKDGLGVTPLMGASYHSVEIAKILLEAKADVELADNRGNMPLHSAVASNNIYSIKILIDAKANVNSRDGERTTPLLKIKCDSDEVAKILLEAKADVNLTGKDGEAPLHRVRRNLTFMHLLLDAKANPNSSCTYSGTLLHQAAADNNIPMITALLNAKTDVNSRTKYGATPLLFVKSNVETAKILLEAKADVNLANNDGEAPLHAEGYDNYDYKRLLLESKANPNVCSEYRATPLHQARTIKEMELLLHYGANINFYHKEKGTPLWHMADCGHITEARFLIKHKADANVKNESGYSILHNATRQHDDDFVKELLKEKADPCAVNKYKENLLHICANVGSIALVNLFIEAKININLTDKWNGFTPLHSAVHNDRPADIINTLLAAKANINVKDSLGFTPLHRAAHRSNTNIIKILLTAKADAYVKDKYGRTFLTHIEKIEDRANLHFSSVAEDAVQWLKKQIKKIHQLEEKSAVINLPTLIRDINKLDEEKVTSSVKFMMTVDLLNNTITKSIKHYESLSVLAKRSALTLNPFNDFYCAAIQDLLQKINSNFAEVPFSLVKNKFIPVAKDLFEIPMKPSLSL